MTMLTHSGQQNTMEVIVKTQLSGIGIWFVALISFCDINSPAILAFKLLATEWSLGKKFAVANYYTVVFPYRQHSCKLLQQHR